MKQLAILAVKSFISFVRMLVKYKLYCSLPKIQSNGTEIHILGNGPSLKTTLNEVSINYFVNKDCLCVNDFALTELYEVIKPQYYVLSDPVYWEDDISLELISAREQLYLGILAKTSWVLSLFLPVNAKNAVDRTGRFDDNSNIKTYYFHTQPSTGFKSITHYYYEHNLGMPPAQNVLVVAIFLAINIGYKSIYIHGADHSWHEDIILNDENVVCIKDRHFYDKGEVVLMPWKIGDKSGSTWKMHEILMALARKFKGYQDLAAYADYRNVKIYNASKKTYIDAFERYKIKTEGNK